VQIRAGVLAVCLLAGILQACPAAAGRPLETDDADTLPPGNLELEASADYAREAGENVWIARGAVNIGLLRRLEGKLELPVVVSDPDGSSSQAGFGDVVAGLKFSVVDETPAVPAVAGAVTVRLPTGDPDRRLGEDGADVTVLGIVGKRIEPFVLHGNVGYRFVTANRRFDVCIVAASVEYQLSTRLSLVGEALGFLPADGDQDASGRFRAGVVYSMRDNVRLDAAVGRGFTRDSPRALVTVGVTIGF
jgi:hypothetical protein